MVPRIFGVKQESVLPFTNFKVSDYFHQQVHKIDKLTKVLVFISILAVLLSPVLDGFE